MAESSQPLSNADRRLAALFPADGPIDRRPKWRRPGTVSIVAVVLVALVIGGAVASSAFGSSGADYRTATVGPEQVDSVLTGVATIEPIAQAAVAFPVSGTVASVNVHVGDSVTAGGVLASLDSQSLMQALHSKQATLAQAQLTLQRALSGQSVGSVGTSGASGSSGSTAGGATSATATAAHVGDAKATIILTAAAPDPALASAQQAVLAAQQQVDGAMQTANAAIADETTACAAFVGASAPTSAGAAPADATACQQAIASVQSAQHDLATAQLQLQTASSALDALLGQRASAPPPSTPTTAPATTPAPTASSPRSGTSSGGSSGGASGTTSSGSGASRAGTSSPSAADLVADQATVDAATITSPLAGTVVAVNLQVGGAVSAGSSTENVVVEGQGGYEISTSVSVDDIRSVSVGQDATVVPDGTHRPLTGKVVGISLVPVSATTAATLYHVVVGLTNPGAPLHDGATGTVALMTGTARAALAVPTSAVTSARNRYFVRVVDNGGTTAVPVQTGVVGATWTEIKRGLHPGEQVVLADLSAPLPGTATSSTNGTATTGVTGRFGGGVGGARSGGTGAGLGTRGG